MKITRAILAALLVLAVVGQSTGAFAYACNAGHYVNSSGHWVHSPTCPGAPGHHEAICRDGRESHSEHRRGTCSHHGGVAHWE
ncbi:DUF3761 domain-containing protein [Rhodoblastus sp.]|uniref:DUF3761 domain-containing protein n=1 Tax=Rhodoblastus sp. TaxID=1962975 RepID=UPI003F99DD45